MEADFEYRPLMIEGAALMATGVRGRRKAFSTGHLRSRRTTRGPVAAKPGDRHAEALGDRARAAPDAVRQALGSNAENSIAFITPSHYEKWDGDVLDSGGLGGTETAVVRLAREFAEKGWRVVVFGTPKHEGVDDHGIEWWGDAPLAPDEPFRAVVALRIPRSLTRRCVMWAARSSGSTM